MTNITINNLNLVNGKLDSGESVPTYTPLVNVVSRSYSNGATAPIFGNGSTVSTDRSFVEDRCIKVPTFPSNPGVTCGSHSFAGRMTLPVNIPTGNTIWQRMKFYIPSAFSFGYRWGSGAPTTPTDDGCGGYSPDGGPQGLKFLVFSPDIGTSRIYLNAPNSLRTIAQTSGTGVLAIESNPSAQRGLSIVYPRDTWFTLELAVKVSNTGTGYVRAWMNDVLIAEAQIAGNKNVSTIDVSASAIKEWGLGSYWNGTPWTDGAAGRDFFYVDEVIVATDVSGYGEPTATDSNGYKMIGSQVRNRDF